MLELYDGKLLRTVLRRERASNRPDLVDYKEILRNLGVKPITIDPGNDIYINPFDIEFVLGLEGGGKSIYEKKKVLDAKSMKK